MTAEVACPRWCKRPRGHYYEDAHLGDGLGREHTATLADVGGLRVELTQWEYAAGAAGPVTLAAPEVTFRRDGNMVELPDPSPEELRRLGSAILEVAERLPQASLSSSRAET
ncbi:DUF6907 domain-containing protein [Nocardioides panacisoli]|uniref:DUF6907 domain-containing protein n=1 Tax=Nocardioides panacisoli TaxID=627624 RepID=UPI003CC7F195